ncbi:MAG TPA: flagellar basal body rod protein FlgG [Clostridiaceae bacterium]|jgi:flagellar basal-body rod protein FlgG|nr:flagellar basal body rod protein FlgG [Clostridiaceae bacterium]
MIRTISNGKSGLFTSQNKMDSIANNIANVNANGYKKIEMDFNDIFYSKMNRKGCPITSDNRDKLLEGSGSRTSAIVANTSEGALKETGMKTDLAITGDGLFRLIGSNGEYFYTKDGAFSLDKDKNIVHNTGMKLEVENYNRNAMSDDFSINENGEIYVKNKPVGKINTYSFVDRDKLVQSCGNIYQTDEEPKNSNSSIEQGFLEQSNVDIAKELTDMIIAQRTYSMNSKSVKTGDEMWQIANNLRNK